MFCPYVRNACIRTTLIKYDNEGNENGSYYIAESYINAECVKEECGVWCNGKCNYRMEENQ